MTDHHDHQSIQAEESHDADHHHDDTAVFRGRNLGVPVYTAVFGLLGILTIIEISLSGVPRGFFTIPIMVTIAIIKAGLVVWFYMHLNKDSRIFALTLLIPFVMVIGATLFLMLVSAPGY
jgi:cytochrome c oxidase subunit 4